MMLSMLISPSAMAGVCVETFLLPTDESDIREMRTSEGYAAS